MTPVRAIAAAIFAAIMVVAGTLIVARTAGREATDLFEILFGGPSPGLLCFLAAAGAALFGAGGVLTAFLAFIAREESDDSPYRRRGFPKSLPLLLIILTLALVWFVLRCAPTAAPETPVAVAVELEATPGDDVEELLEGADPVPEIVDEGPFVAFGETRFDWTFKDPLISRRGPVWMANNRPFTDESDAALLCGKAWVAVTGSASEEGPADRNAARSRLRASAAADAARRWAARHPDCGETFVFGVDLGQHAATSPDDTGAATAYQRRVLVIARTRTAEEFLDAETARAELTAILADPIKRSVFLGARRFPSPPVILP